MLSKDLQLDFENLLQVQVLSIVNWIGSCLVPWIKCKDLENYLFIVVWIIQGILVKFDDPNIVLMGFYDGIAMNVVFESL